MRAATARGISEPITDEKLARRTRPALSPTWADSSASAASILPRISAAREASNCPAGVSRIPRPARWSSCAPVSASSLPRWWLTVGCVYGGSGGVDDAFVAQHDPGSMPRSWEPGSGGTTRRGARDGPGGRGSKDVRIGGGPTVVREFLAAGLVDHLHLAVVPILLGRGVRLWEGLEGHAPAAAMR